MKYINLNKIEGILRTILSKVWEQDSKKNCFTKIFDLLRKIGELLPENFEEIQNK